MFYTDKGGKVTTELGRQAAEDLQSIYRQQGWLLSYAYNKSTVKPYTRDDLMLMYQVAEFEVTAQTMTSIEIKIKKPMVREIAECAKQVYNGKIISLTDNEAIIDVGNGSMFIYYDDLN